MIVVVAALAVAAVAVVLDVVVLAVEEDEIRSYRLAEIDHYSAGHSQISTFPCKAPLIQKTDELSYRIWIRLPLSFLIAR